VQLPRIVRDFSFQAFGTYVSAALQMLRGLVLAWLLGPLGLGSFAIVSIVLAYAQHADLGITAAVGREIPLSTGAGRDRQAEEWRWYALACKLIADAAFILVLAVVLLTWGGSWPSDLRFGLITAIGVIPLQGIVIVAQTVLEARQLFPRATVVATTLACGLTVAMVAGAALAGVSGGFAGQLLGFGIAACVGLALWGTPRACRLQRKRVTHLLRIGLPLVALSFVGYNLVYVDQLMVLCFLGRGELGIYSLALSAGSALFLLPLSLAATVSPRLIRRYGRESTVEAIADYTWRPVRLLSLTLPPAIMAIWLVAPVLIAGFLPEFTSAIVPLRIYIVGMFFMGLNYGVSSTLLAINKHRYNVPILLACVALNIALDVGLLTVLHLGLAGVAIGSAVTYFVYWMAHTTLVRWFFHERPFCALRHNLASGWPGLVLGMLVLVLAALGHLGAVDALLSLILLILTLATSVVRWRYGIHGAEGA
jgi:O-antigen/teichoic acid export membrane protein